MHRHRPLTIFKFQSDSINTDMGKDENDRVRL